MLKKNPKNSLIVAVVVLIIVALGYYFFRQTNSFNDIVKPFDLYLSAILHVVHFLHNIGGNGIELNGFAINLIDGSTYDFDTGFIMKKWFFFLFLLIILTPSSWQKKFKYTSFLILFHFVNVTISISNCYLLFQNGVNTLDSKLISHALATLLFFITIPYWIKNNPSILEWISKKTKTEHSYIVKKFNLLIKLFYGLIILNFINGFFQFEPWIRFIFTIDHHILGWIGYNSWVEPFHLMGEYGNIYMAKGCLGFMTTYIFVAFVFLTGEGLKKIIYYSLIGTLIINLSNILRFVFLFIHLQEYGEYMWNMEIHDLFNIIIYAIVLALWIIWLEKFTDIWPYLKGKKNASN